MSIITFIQSAALLNVFEMRDKKKLYDKKTKKENTTPPKKPINCSATVQNYRSASNIRNRHGNLKVRVVYRITNNNE